MFMTAASSTIVKPTMARIPGGTVLMGAQSRDESAPNYSINALDREGPVREVTVPTFDIGVVPVTVGQFGRYAEEFAGQRFGVFGRRRYAELVGSEGQLRVREEMHLIMRGATADMTAMRPVSPGDPNVAWGDFDEFTEPVEIVPEQGWLREKGDAFLATNAPVTGVSWFMAQAFIEWLRVGLEDPRLMLLPEAYLERAMRGPEGMFAFGTATGEISPDLAVYGQGTITNVGTKPGIQWGDATVYDLAGLVWEWASDWFAPFSHGEQVDPHGPESGTAKVLRGGYWGAAPGHLRFSARNRDEPTYRYDHVGFRVGRRLVP